MDSENAQSQFRLQTTSKSADLCNVGYDYITIPWTHERHRAGERSLGVINRQRRRHSSPRKPRPIAKNSKTALVALLATIPMAMAETCVSLSGSTTCPAFDAASISTDSTLTGLFPFLQYVSDRETFDTELQSYVSTTYVQTKYETLLGCADVHLTNTTDYYARYTTTVICNSIVQNSISPCGLSTSSETQPVCADTCAQYAESEDLIINEPSLCGNASSDALTQIRADFTNCALPASSLGGSCISGSDNEPDNCGYGNSTLGLCTYCASGGENSTDTCCYSSGASTKCENVVLPTIVASMTFAISSSATPSATASSTGSASATHRKGLSGGAIAGIVIGSVAGLALLATLIFLLLLCLRRRRQNQPGVNVLNQPSPARTPNPMSYNPITNKGSTPANGYEVLPGGRIARMSALEGHSGHSGSRGNSVTYSVPMTAGAAAATGAVAGYASGAARHGRNSYASSDEYSQPSTLKGGILHPPPNRRTGSLSSGSAFGGFDEASPHSRAGSDQLSSPLGANSQKSEELSCFKDYYSQDNIHVGDKVATLWAYTPRAGDEHKLERGDMLRIVGIWDDGWATGVLLQQRADDWENRNILRDSGVSSGANQGDSSPVVSDEVKAFPLVCVCLPDQWRKTIEGDGSTESGDNQRDLPIMGQP